MSGLSSAKLKQGVAISGHRRANLEPYMYFGGTGGLISSLKGPDLGLGRDIWIDRWTDRQMDRRKNRWKEIHPCVLCPLGQLPPPKKKKNSKSVKWSAVPVPCPKRFRLKLGKEEGQHPQRGQWPMLSHMRKFHLLAVGIWASWFWGWILFLRLKFSL